MTDLIKINDLRVATIIGALEHERALPQPLRIDLKLEVDLHDAALTDELDDTVDYGRIAERVAAVATESRDILLERLATRLAKEVLSFDLVDAVHVELTKLRPPIPLDVVDTAVQIRRTRAETLVTSHDPHVAIVALGSNMGDRAGYLRLAMEGLGRTTAMSRVYETDPVGGPNNQGPYLNMVIAIDTALDPFSLLRRCQRLETAAMRQRHVHWGPRTLDVDILFYDEVVIDSPNLTIPHPRLGERRFVLEPLADIAPDRCPDGWDDRLPPGGISPLGQLDFTDPKEPE